MRSFVFVRVEVRSHTILVHADDRLVAEVKATVGGLEYIGQKEGVEVSVGSESTVNTFLVREE